jgi:hypothetical protein
MKRLAGCVTALIFVSSLSACGGTKGPTTPSDDEVSAGSAAIAAGDFAVVAFTLTSRVPLRTQIDWSVAANDLDAFLIRGTCSRTDVLNALPGCTMDAVVLGSATGVTKPEVFTTTALDPGPYTLLVVNRGSQNDTCNYRVTKSG